MTLWVSERLEVAHYIWSAAGEARHRFEFTKRWNYESKAVSRFAATALQINDESYGFTP